MFQRPLMGTAQSNPSIDRSHEPLRIRESPPSSRRIPCDCRCPRDRYHSIHCARIPSSDLRSKRRVCAKHAFSVLTTPTPALAPPSFNNTCMFSLLCAGITHDRKTCFVQLAATSCSCPIQTHASRSLPCRHCFNNARQSASISKRYC